MPHSNADDLRKLGWSVASHNDYRQNGEPHTFWLITHPDGRYLKGEGRTDAEALDIIRAQLGYGPVISPGSRLTGPYQP